MTGDDGEAEYVCSNAVRQSRSSVWDTIQAPLLDEAASPPGRSGAGAYAYSAQTSMRPARLLRGTSAGVRDGRA